MAGTSVTTQLTEAGQREAERELADIIREAVSDHNDVDGVFWIGVARDVTEAVCAAQILLTTEGGGGLREEARGYFDSLMQIVGWLRDAQKIPKPRDAIGLDDIDDDEIEAAAYFIDRLAALAPKTSVPGSDAAMREAVAATMVAASEDNAFLQETLRRRSERAALSSPTGSAGDDETGVREAMWRPMNDAPADGKTLIVARHQPNEHTPHGWIATILRGDGDEESPNHYDQIIHYNGDRLQSNFRGMWTGWMYPEEFAALAPQPPKAETPAGVAPPERIAQALMAADWSGVSIGNKLLISSAAVALSLAPAARAGDGVEALTNLAKGIVADHARWGNGTAWVRAARTALALNGIEFRDNQFVTLTAEPAANGEGA